jgi:hypothetical protein
VSSASPRGSSTARPAGASHIGEHPQGSGRGASGVSQRPRPGRGYRAGRGVTGQAAWPGSLNH